MGKKVLVYLITFCLAGFMALGPVLKAWAEEEPGQITEKAKPAVVMIQTNFNTQVVVPEPTVPEERIKLLQQKILVMAQQGLIPLNEEAFVNAAIQELLNHPLDYMVPGNDVRREDVTISAIGSGFVITPDGYVVTNAHVVQPDEKEIKKQLIVKALTKYVDQGVQELSQAFGSRASQDKIREAVIAYFLNYTKMGKVEKTIYTAMGVTVPGVGIAQKGFASDVRTIGKPIPGKDVAILKIDKENLPTLALGDDKVLNTGDRVYVIGYPGAATFHPLLSNESQVEPTLTTGLISAKKSMPEGWTVLQTDAAMTHGNSGGPVLDKQGKVIGIATFGSVDANTGQEIAGMNFVVPIDVVKQFLNEINVQPKEGTVSKLYAEALADFQKQYYKAALKQFQEINAIAPGIPYVEKYISDSQTAIAEGRDKSIPVVLYIVAVLAVIIIGVAAYVLVRKNQKKKLSTPPENQEKMPTDESEPGSSQDQSEVNKDSSS